VAQSVIEGQRGIHAEYVFTYQGHRVETGSNNGWQRAREETIADILWGKTAHYSVAQIEELVEALELITDERSRTNRSLDMIWREQLGRLTPQKVPTESKKANQRLA
jgi:hypothetical protein